MKVRDQKLCVPKHHNPEEFSKYRLICDIHYDFRVISLY